MTAHVQGARTGLKVSAGHDGKHICKGMRGGAKAPDQDRSSGILGNKARPLHHIPIQRHPTAMMMASAMSARARRSDLMMACWLFELVTFLISGRGLANVLARKRTTQALPTFCPAARQYRPKSSAKLSAHHDPSVNSIVLISQSSGTVMTCSMIVRTTTVRDLIDSSRSMLAADFLAATETSVWLASRSHSLRPNCPAFALHHFFLAIARGLRRPFR